VLNEPIGYFMKQPRQPARTRARILDKATALFAAKGYDGASVGDIVRAAKVNKRMLYHYFGDKHGLYRAVFLAQWLELKEWFDRALSERRATDAAAGADLRALLAQALGIFFDFVASHERFVRLIMWEGLEGGAISRSIWTDVRGPLYVQVEFLVAEAKRQGILPRAVDPAHLIISFLGAVTFYFGYAPTLTDMLGKDPLAPATLRQRKQQLTELLAAALRP
jgi:TetR/AcrR family transcriptional regulator